MKTLPIEILRELLAYDPATGILTWKKRPVHFFPSNTSRPQQLSANTWNTRFSEKQAFTAKNQDGYLIGKVLNIDFRAHVVAFALHTGKWPEDEVDHENHKRDDNRFENLKEATHIENMRNTKRQKNMKIAPVL